ncbi:MAG: FKBP-type peptidyl-prolyl cis-trans isomerase 2 [Planctomycetota bacterium]
MKIQSGLLVELEYQILDDKGDLHESSEEGGPLVYIQGSGDLPEDLERKLEGLSAGESTEVTCAPGHAFGEYSPEGLITVPRDEFPEDAELKKGEVVVFQLEEHETEEGADDEDEDEIEMRIMEVGPDGVVLDANHPLASKAVTFKVKVLAVREGEEEKEEK